MTDNKSKKITTVPFNLKGMLQATYFQRKRLEKIEGTWILEPFSGNWYLLKVLGNNYFILDDNTNIYRFGEA